MENDALCRPLTPDDSAAFVEFLGGFPTTEYRDWARLFHHGWNVLDDTVGFGLFHNEKPVGYLGTIQTQRTLAGSTFRLVNLSTWFVEKPYRAHSLDPQRMVLAYENCISVGHTIIPQVVKRYESIGYVGFDFYTRLMFWNPLAGIVRSREFSVCSDEAALAYATDEEQRYVRDHRSCDCIPFAVTTSTGDRCFIMAQRVLRRYKGQVLATAHCVYVSDRDLFRRLNAQLRNAIMKRLDCRLLAIDERYVVDAKVPLSMRIPMITPRMSRNNIGFDPLLLDNLYTELVLFKY